MNKPPKRVLFVDDEVNVLNSLRRSLKAYPELHYSFATSLHEAIEHVVKMMPDVIVSDMKMPQKNGLDLIKHFKSMPQTTNIPVIILTGSNEHNLKTLALTAGAIDLVNKPISTIDLITRIRNVLKLKEYQDSLEEKNAILEQQIQLNSPPNDIVNKDFVWRMAKVGELRDYNMSNHVSRVSAFCKILCEASSMSQSETDLITLASSLHDIGKGVVPDSVILKPGKLTVEEHRMMQTHAHTGAKILSEELKTSDNTNPEQNDISFREIAAEIAMTHHEKWDGSGYPLGLEGEDIPLPGRITAIADVYDALRSPRPYKEAYSAEKAYDIMLENEGTHFDPALIKLFKENRDKFEEISTIMAQ